MLDYLMAVVAHHHYYLPFSTDSSTSDQCYDKMALTFYRANGIKVCLTTEDKPFLPKLGWSALSRVATVPMLSHTCKDLARS